MSEHSCALQNEQAHLWQAEKKAKWYDPQMTHDRQLCTKSWSHCSTVGLASCVISLSGSHQAEHDSSFEGNSIES